MIKRDRLGAHDNNIMFHAWSWPNSNAGQVDDNRDIAATISSVGGGRRDASVFEHGGIGPPRRMSNFLFQLVEEDQYSLIKFYSNLISPIL